MVSIERGSATGRASARRRWPCVLVAVLLLLGLACGGDDDGGDVVGGGVQATFAASGTSPAANLVFLRGGTVSADLVTVEVVIGGPTTTQALYSFAFDLVLSDPTVAAYENGTAAFGTALTLGGGQGALVQAVQTGDRVVCGVTKTGGGSGNGVTASTATVLTLSFRVLRAGTTTITLAGPPANPPSPAGQPQALAPNGSVITTVVFDSAPASLSGV